MNTQNLRELLGGLSGHLVTDSPRQEQEGDELHELLARSLLPEDVREIKRSSFAFEQADLFSAENIPTARAEIIQAVAERRATGDAEAEFRVFARELPVRSTQLHASTPLWAGGAAVERTLGPFLHADGRQFWFDFIRIERLVALYVQGTTDPVLLFKIRTRPIFIDINQPFAADSASRYELVAGSIWINSRLLATNAPAGYYTGLTIEDGTIQLSAPPQALNGKLTAAKSTVVRVNLRLRQPDVTNADPTSPYGMDARAATIQLPEKFAFRFSGAAGSTFDDVSESAWNVYGDDATFRWDAPHTGSYDDQLHRVLIPLVCSAQQFTIRDAQSRFNTLSGEAGIKASAWALPAAPIDVAQPTPAAGIGGLLVRCRRGLASAWQKLENGPLALREPVVLVEPGRISITDQKAGEMVAQQTFELWQDKQNPFGTRVQIQYPQGTLFFYFTLASGDELLAALGNADAQIDRPVNVAGAPPAVKSKNTLLILAVSKSLRFVYLFDDNILLDNVDTTKKPPTLPQPIALALKNALFKVTPVNACLLFGYLTEDLGKVERGWLYLTFGLYAYLPTLPDPYAANLGCLKRQFRGRSSDPFTGAALSTQSIWMWLVCLVHWQPAAQPLEDEVNVSFHFAPFNVRSARVAFDLLTETCQAMLAPRPGNPDTPVAHSTEEMQQIAQAASANNHLPDYQALWYDQTHLLEEDTFALLDVSTNADLLGVSFGANILNDNRYAMLRTHVVAPVAAPPTFEFPLQVRGMDVVSQSGNVRAFTVPQISWEPVFNLSPPPSSTGVVVVQGINGQTVIPPPHPTVQGDPPVGFNYYPDDGGPTRIVNSGTEQVTLAPIPLTEFMISSFKDERFFAYAMFGLPFGMKALALLQDKYPPGRRGTRVDFNYRKFADEISTTRRLRVRAGEPEVKEQDEMFMGSTVQLNNLRRFDGSAVGESTLGGNVTEIFNNDFFIGGPLIKGRGVPLTRIDLSGYGASIFSNWRNPKAPIASTSQAKFDVFLGRCAHEVIQVSSILYPWGCKVVRTITLFRTSTGYEYRIDSGWKAQSDGLFDFMHYAYVPGPPGSKQKTTTPVPGFYEIHPGVVKGLFNIREIKETGEVQPYTGSMTIAPHEKYVQSNGDLVTNGATAVQLPFKLQPVYFNADVEIENPVSGHITATVNGKQKQIVPSKGILGFVQIVPLGQPLTVTALRELFDRQGTIGGPFDCAVNIGASGQQMRLNRFDVSNSFAGNGTDYVFAAAGRGSVILPKDGSWSMVKHEHANGAVSPVPQDLSVPLIRAGKITQAVDPLQVSPAPAQSLLRVANPTELLRPPTRGTATIPATLNYGFLHSTDTQKALFLNPAFQQGVAVMLSKTPPLFADAFRVVNSKGIFPNIGDAVTGFGDAISLGSGGEFAPLNVGGQQVFKLMQIDKVTAGVREEGYKLLKQLPDVPFQLPAKEWELISVGTFRIYIEYKADNVKLPDGSTGGLPGGLNFDVDSFAGAVSDRWKSHMKNVAIVIDLGPIKRLMTIKGNWDAKKGTEAQYAGGGLGEVPQPQIEFAGALQPIIAILDILDKLQSKDYKGAFGSGVRLAMSNKAGSWEYKFEASKEIPVLRFPPGLLYNDPNAIFKLEAGLKLGAYFNAALQIPVSPTQLLPSAGAYIGLYARLSIMCISLSIATVYAVGQANLDIGCDTKGGPFLRMKFGFGAQLVVGLPVVGNVSILYMVGVEIFTDSTTVQVSAFLLYQGHAELLGGLVGVTITIEAKGTYKRITSGSSSRTDLAAQVTFGIDISIFLVIDISFSQSWEEQRQIA